MSELTKVRKSVIDPTQVIPEMAGQNGKVLSTNGTRLEWVWGRIVGEICRFSFDTPPPGFFALDGSRIPNGKNDFPALAESGSRFITVSGNDLILKGFVDFGRGKGSSGRSLASFEGDAIRNIIGEFGLSNVVGSQPDGYLSGVFSKGKSTSARPNGVNTSGSYMINFQAGRVVPIANENRPKSLTELVCIYHGVI